VIAGPLVAAVTGANAGASVGPKMPEERVKGYEEGIKKVAF
jgi:hypothetical protein